MTGATFATLFDNHGIPVAQNAKGKVQNDIVKLATPYFLKIKEIMDQIKGSQTDRICVEWDNHDFLVLPISSPLPLILLIVSPTGKIDKNSALNLAMPIIQAMIG